MRRFRQSPKPPKHTKTTPPGLQILFKVPEGLSPLIVAAGDSVSLKLPPEEAGKPDTTCALVQVLSFTATHNMALEPGAVVALDATVLSVRRL